MFIPMFLQLYERLDFDSFFTALCNRYLCFSSDWMKTSKSAKSKTLMKPHEDVLIDPAKSPKVRSNKMTFRENIF